MDWNQFDQLTRAFASRSNRRRFTTSVVALAATAMGIVGSTNLVEAGKKRTGGETCRVNAECYSGLCGKASDGRRRCQSGVCDVGKDKTSGDLWTICRQSSDSAWISTLVGGTYYPEEICASLGYATWNRYGGNCGSVCGFCEQGTSCTSPGREFYDGGANEACPPYSHCGLVTWECVNPV